MWFWSRFACDVYGGIEGVNFLFFALGGLVSVGYIPLCDFWAIYFFFLVLGRVFLREKAGRREIMPCSHGCIGQRYARDAGMPKLNEYTINIVYYLIHSLVRPSVNMTTASQAIKISMSKCII